MSVEQVFALNTPGNGIIGVERGPDGNIYFSTTTAIYVYRLKPQQTLTSTSQVVYEYDPRQASIIIAVVLVVFIVVAGLLLYRRQPNRSRKA